MNTNTLVEAAKTIRTALKAAGIAPAMVSVKSERFAGGSAIDITIKSDAVNVETVKRVAREHERLHHDGAGNVTAGGNRYVSVIGVDGATIA